MRTTRTAFGSLAFAASLGLFDADRAYASPQDIFGFGIRSQGMGLTGASYSTGYEAVFTNPAGIADTPGRQLSLGFSGNVFMLEVDGERTKEPDSRGILIGLGLPLPFGGPLEDVLSVAAGFFTPTNTVMQAEAPYPERRQWLVLSRSQVVCVQFALGIDLGRWAEGLSLGVGISGSANTKGEILAGIDAANQFVSRTETQLTTAFAPVAGIRYARGRFAAGITYHAEIESRINMNVVVTDLPVAIPQLTLYALAQYDPHAVMAEFSMLAREDLRVVAALYYRRWSVYEGRLSKTSAGSNEPPPPEFHDTVSPRVGIEWTNAIDRTSYAVRGGYAYEPTPAPPARYDEQRDSFGQPIPGTMTPVRYLDSDRHILTAGFGLEHRLDDTDGMRFSVDVQANLHVLPERTHRIPDVGQPENMVSRGFIPGAGLILGATW